MDKHKYYVSVHGRSVLPDKTLAAYEWEIYATPAQAEEMLLLMGLVQEKEEEAFPGYVFPWPDTPEQVVNVYYEDALNDVYQKIYELGSEDTREQMKGSGINAFLGL
ncbi:hypothetical protein [Paenibacillus sp. IHBB 10380]|uniref:hypothetical protein n=1 Tax=Paenibacillus sp. IHBB 10380 TaxID=1566358 RepID=UPI0005CFC148|nr:hypothetical protein [Paenibacillus sp. IHBB 10380]AJS57479.1 hypothetical protein UB51_02085 [Paenibacillus sp. IHBB 10380]